MKIVSLLPSATEIVYELGLAEHLSGVSFECDHPEAARRVPVVSGTALPTGADLDAKEIDAEVTSRLEAGEAIYTLDRDLLRSIEPDLILAQDLCRVCAVPSGAVEEALGVIGCHAEVVSLDPNRLDDVIDTIGTVGRATNSEDRANVVMAGLRRRLDTVRKAVAGRPRPRVLVVEWPDPLFNGGHWVPDMISCAGGAPVLAAGGEPSRRLTWREVESEQVELTVFAPCGYDLEGAVAQAESLLSQPEAAGRLGHVYAVDANAYFSRPGPRVVDGVELLAQLMHGGDPGEVAPDRARRLA